MFIKNILSFAYLLKINIKYRYINMYIYIYIRIGLEKILENKLNSYFFVKKNCKMVMEKIISSILFQLLIFIII